MIFMQRIEVKLLQSLCPGTRGKELLGNGDKINEVFVNTIGSSPCILWPNMERACSRKTELMVRQKLAPQRSATTG